MVCASRAPCAARPLHPRVDRLCSVQRDSPVVDERPALVYSSGDGSYGKSDYHPCRARGASGRGLRGRESATAILDEPHSVCRVKPQPRSPNPRLTIGTTPACAERSGSACVVASQTRSSSKGGTLGSTIEALALSQGRALAWRFSPASAATLPMPTRAARGSSRASRRPAPGSRGSERAPLAFAARPGER
jgi:hypothetical protein